MSIFTTKQSSHSSLFVSQLVVWCLSPRNVSGEFLVGRLSEGQFEYPDLNGWMTPSQAKDLCDHDFQCGGFTYKGTIIMDREVEVYFFHIPLHVETDLKSWKWIYYIPSRNFVTFPGVFEGGSSKQNMRFIRDSPEHIFEKGLFEGGSNQQNLKFSGESPEHICEKDNDCVAIIKTNNISTYILVDYIDMDTFKKRFDKATMVKIRNITEDTNIDASNPWNDIDTCCPKHKKTNLKLINKRINDTMPRISCDISPDDFLTKYVKKRVPVMLVNCTNEFDKQQYWTFDKLLGEMNGKLMWTSDFHSTLEKYNRYDSDEPISGNLLKQIVKDNGTIRIFDKLGRKMHTYARRNGINEATDKMHLFDDYSKPAPVPADYFEKAGMLTDYQWLILSMKDTGTELHTDPEYTSPWNTVFSGYKWWVIMPPEVLPEAFLCDEECSDIDTEDDINIESWYSHVLPQLRGRSWYGSQVREFIQGPGETIYMPGNIAHAILNIDENISVTENYFLVDSLDDWIHGMMTGDVLLDEEDYDEKDGWKFWKAMYYKNMGSENRKAVRAMINQVEQMATKFNELCDDEDSKDHEDDVTEYNNDNI